MSLALKPRSWANRAPVRMPIKISKSFIGGPGLKIRGGGDFEIEDNTFGPDANIEISGVRSAKISGSKFESGAAKGAPRPNPNQRPSAGGDSVGWTRPGGPPLPVYCPNCKAIFPSKRYFFSGAFFNVWNNEEVCIECGFEHARLSEGIFDLAGEAVRILSAPDITHVMLRSVLSISNELLSGTIGPESAVQKYQKVLPRLGKLARTWLRRGKETVIFLGAVAGIVSLYQIELGREQVRLGREQVALQRESNESSNRVVERILHELSQIVFNTNGAHQRDASKATAQKKKGGRRSIKRRLRTR